MDIGAENTFTREDLEFMRVWIQHTREKLGIPQNVARAEKCIRLLDVAIGKLTPKAKGKGRKR